MPIYEYECDECKQKFAIQARMSEPTLKNHNEASSHGVLTSCQGTVRKLISLCGFQLKGTGWYGSDYSGKTSK